MQDIEIRNVEIEDIEQIVDIQIEGWKTAYKGIIDEEFLNNMNREDKIKQRKKDYKENGFIVAVVNNEIVGFCRYMDYNSNEYTEVDCQLGALYVKCSQKRNGIGRKLMSYVIEEFKSKDKSKMILWCLKENTNARRFYEKMGGHLYKEKIVQIGINSYEEVSYIYNLKKI